MGLADAFFLPIASPPIVGSKDINRDGNDDIDIDTDGDGSPDYNISNAEGIPANFSLGVNPASIDDIDISEIYLGFNIEEPTDFEGEHTFADLIKSADVLVWDNNGSFTRGITTTGNFNSLGYPIQVDSATTSKIEYRINNTGSGTLQLLVYGNLQPIGTGIKFKSGLTLNSSQDLGNNLYRYNLSSPPADVANNVIISFEPGFGLDASTGKIELIRDRADVTHLGPLHTNGFADFATNSETGRSTAYATIRYMEWHRTNVNDSSVLNVLNPSEFASYYYGVPLEVLNSNPFSVNARPNPWFCIHHLTGDPGYDGFEDEWFNFIVQYLENNPDVSVYVEHSNEVWNTSFPQNSWCLSQSLPTFAGTPSYTHGNSLKLLEYHALRTSQLSLRLKSYFSATPERIIGVFGGQAANVWSSEQPLKYTWLGGSTHAAQGIDAIAIAPYFGGYIGHASNLSILLNWRNEPDKGVSKVFEELTIGGLLPNSPTDDGGNVLSAIEKAEFNVTKHAAYTQANGLQLLAYEGGQHLAGVGAAQSNDEVTELLEAVNRDPRMEKVYEDYLARMFRAGVQLFCHFRGNGTRSSQFGLWGLSENTYDAPELSPKYRAWKKFVDKSQLRNGGIPNDIDNI